MSQKQVYASLDIGSSTIKLLVGELVHQNVRILRVETVPSKGVKRGVIIDEDLVVGEIKSLITKVEYLLNVKLTGVVLTIPSICLKLYQGRGSYVIKRDEKVFTAYDYKQAIQASGQFSLDKDEIVVSMIPLNYVIDGRITRRLLIGEVGRQIVANTLVITAPKEMVFPFASCVEKAGLEIIDICVSAYAHASEALDETYLNEGVILIDIGSQVTSVTVFDEGYLKTIGSLPIGGYQITKDIARHFGVEMSQAEQFKIKFGTCSMDEADDDIIHVAQIDGEEFPLTQKDLCKIINQRLDYQLQAIKSQISSLLMEHHYHIVVVGGGAQLVGVERRIAEVLGFNSKVYVPDTIGARRTIYTPVLGAIYYFIDRQVFMQETRTSVDEKSYEQAINVRRSVLKGIGNDEGTLLNRVVDFLIGEEDN